MQKDQCEETNDIGEGGIEVAIRSVDANGQTWFQIDERYVPVLFRFNYSALLQVRMSTDSKVPPYAHWLFQELISKILTTRYSSSKSRKNLTQNTRMKSQEKVKFLIRAFQIKYCKQFEVSGYTRMQKFNSCCQQQFFKKQEVKDHFLAFLPAIIKEKHLFNQTRIREVEKDLAENMRLGIKYPQKGKDHFRRVIDKLQLPWTDNMFADVEAFGRKLYETFALEGESKVVVDPKEQLLKEGDVVQI